MDTPWLPSVKINKRKPQLKQSQEGMQRELPHPTTLHQLPQTGKHQLPQKGICQFLTPTGRHHLQIPIGRDVPCTPKQEGKLLYYPSRRKEVLLFAQQQAQPMEKCQSSANEKLSLPEL